MFHGLLLIIFLVVLLVTAVFLCKMLFSSPTDKQETASIKRYGQTEAPPSSLPQALPPAPTPELYYQPPREWHYNRSSQSGVIMLVLLTSFGYLIYENRDTLKEKFATSTSDEAGFQQKETVSLANISGHEIVDGVNWFMIVATSTEGAPFTGWVSEMAIQKEPPKENVASDEMMKKLGLPTNRERIESLKKPKNVGQALNTALKDMRQNRN